MTKPDDEDFLVPVRDEAGVIHEVPISELPEMKDPLWVRILRYLTS